MLKIIFQFRWHISPRQIVAERHPPGVFDTMISQMYTAVPGWKRKFQKCAAFPQTGAETHKAWVCTFWEGVRCSHAASYQDTPSPQIGDENLPGCFDFLMLHIDYLHSCGMRLCSFRPKLNSLQTLLTADHCFMQRR